jgi:hypothetical protein
MIADAVKSRGRSRHGHLAGAAMTVVMLKGRQRAPTGDPRLASVMELDTLNDHETFDGKRFSVQHQPEPKREQGEHLA